MSYQKQIFSDGDVLNAAQLNAMDEQIALNEAELLNKQPIGDYALNSSIPSKISELENDSGFITSVPVVSVNGKTGDVQLDADDVGALPNTTVIPVVPSALSEFSDDSTHRLVTDTEKSAWNAKADVSYVDEEVAALVNSAPEALNTLEELANALGNDENFATTVTNHIGLKADISYVDTELAKKVSSTRKINNKELSADIALTASDVGALPDTTNIPTVLPNPNALTIDGVAYDGSEYVAVYTGGGKSVLAYGAKGNGSTDDTAAFQSALAENRVVTVPGGTYVLNGTLVIRENCCLVLSQDTVLKFTQTDADGIQMRGSGVLRGNHALIIVPYEFTEHVIDLDTIDDGYIHANIPPYALSSPMFRRQRFVYDVNIIKAIDFYGKPGLCKSKDGGCNGTGIYMSATKDGDASTTDISFMWAITMSGIRIAGGFNYGIHAINFDSPSDFSGHYEDDAWNHDMRIEAVIEGCEIGVALENCNGAHLDVTIEPAAAEDGTKYAKHGIYLNDARFVDLMRSRVWDWNANGTLWASGGQYQHLALIGNCRGLILDDFVVNEESGDIRNRIYTDTLTNFDTMVVLPELTSKNLRLKSEKIATEDTDFIHESAETKLLDDNIKVKAENIIGDIGGDAETETVLSDNLLDKSLMTKGYLFYYGSSGYTMAGSEASYTYHGFIPLRGAGTYRTKFQMQVHESTGTRIALVNDDNAWVANATGTCGEVVEDNNWVDFEFIVTEAHIAAGVTKVAFDVYSPYYDKTMIVKDREYPSEYIPYGYIEVATDSGKKQDNVLCEKTAVFLGDSICEGDSVGSDSAYYKYGWAGLIGEANHMSWFNYGKGGGTITSQSGYACISTIADTAISEHPTVDYVIFEGGCNDSDVMKEDGLGEMSADYATFDTATFSGALEALILKLVTAYPYAKIGYIVPQKMYAGFTDFTAEHHRHRLYFDRAVEICQKWGIPVIDIWNTTPLNPKLPTASVYYSDGIQHLTEAGYQRITPAIEAWMRML